MAHGPFERIFSFFPNFVPKIPEKIAGPQSSSRFDKRLGLRALSFKLTLASIEYASEQAVEVRQAGSLTSYFPQIFENFAPRFPENVIGAKLRLSLLTVAEIR